MWGYTLSMKFYEVPPEVENAIKNTDSRPFVRVVFELSSGDLYICDSDILECVMTSYKNEDGGIVNMGEILLDNSRDIYDVFSNNEFCPGLGVQIWYCFGERTNTFFRFHKENTTRCTIQENVLTGHCCPRCSRWPGPRCWRI